MFKWFFIFLLVLILIFIVFYNVLKWTEDKVLYYPSRKCVWRPDCDYVQVYINVKDSDDVCYSRRKKSCKKEYISGWHFNNYPGAKTILFCHGNSGNISHRKYIIDICRRLHLNLFVFDYRGYGKSDSFAYKTFVKEDGEAAYEYLRYYCGIKPKNITIWGESIGGYPASWIASKYSCNSLILMCTFSSLDDIMSYKFSGTGQKAIKVLTGLASYQNDMLSIKDCLLKIKCPIAIIHSNKDELVPYECSWVNYHSIKHDNKMHFKIKGKHASPHIRKSQFRKVFEFCDIKISCCDEEIKCILDDLKTFAERHNNFMESY